MRTRNQGINHGNRIPVFIEGGRVLEQTPTAEFFRRPRTAAAGDFIRDEIP